ncbi:DNA-3-methyladenine glycosylase 2 family protein [Megasphaera hominis]|uniref:DNA-3-methyladenine glycosylase II n=2 Tax=Megasphaera hominis TaxID=159836 RepID=A0ABR6VF02_9FIRM|nr:DNA-3-methyladenine glycosylase 2 family protein [Megasphaera hominis]
MYFRYGEKEIEYLKSRDKKLASAMDRIGHVYRETDVDLFSSVVHHIIGQQISTAAQKTIWERLSAKLNKVDAAGILSLNRDELQSVGMTYKKADYILDFAGKVQNGSFNIEALEEMTDEQVIRELSSLKGIGVWTAEMIMTFCMQRPDVVSYGDLAIIRGMRMLYRHREIDKEKFIRYRKRYSPYGTVASLYLWAIAGGAIPELTDPAPKRKKS